MENFERSVVTQVGDELFVVDDDDELVCDVKLRYLLWWCVNVRSFRTVCVVVVHKWWWFGAWVWVSFTFGIRIVIVVGGMKGVWTECLTWLLVFWLLDRGVQGSRWDRSWGFRQCCMVFYFVGCLFVCLLGWCLFVCCQS